MIKIINNELVLSQTWSDNPHGICGHTFELIDYYMILKNHFDIIIYLTELTYEELIIAIESKYDFKLEERNDILKHIIITEQPTLLKVKNILFVDGSLENIKNINIISDNIITFSCGDKEAYKTKDKKFTILQDESPTPYGKVYSPGPRTIHYKKKVLYRFKKATPKKRTLLYLTTNCRKYPIDEVKNLIYQFDKEYNREWLIATNDLNYYNILQSNKIEVLQLPIENFHDQFDNYIYTPLERKWDCSNRLIVECRALHKNFQYYLPDDYLSHDKALLVRRFDLEQNKVQLKENDEIIGILDEVINSNSYS